MAKEIPAFCGSEEITDIADGPPKCLDGSCSLFAQVFFELCECKFDRIEVGGIGRQEERPGAAILDDLRHARPFVGGQIVHDNNIASGKIWGELRLDIGLEGATVHWSVQHPGCCQATASESGNEGLGVPVAEGDMHSEPFAARCPPSQARHLRRRSGLIDEDQTVRFKAHARLAKPDPRITLLGDVGAFLFAGDQCFF
jgi:hypothetical protein